MKSKILLATFSIFVILMAASVSAVVTYGDWEDGSQSIQITDGQSVDFNVDLFSLNPPMVVNVKLYDSGSNLVHSFETDRLVNSNGFSQTYTLTNSMYSGTGSYELIITGSDAFPSTQSYSLFLNVNPALPSNSVPVITSSPITIVDENTVYSYQVTATDADGQTLTYSLPNAPTWLSINANTGLITGTAPSVNTDTPFNVEVQVSDGIDITNQTYTLTVIDTTVPPTNNPPVITSTPITQVDEGQVYIYQATATDADGDTLTYSLTQAPSWLFINSNTGYISGVAPSVTADTGFNVQLEVSDGVNPAAIQTFTITVLDVSAGNNVPVITSTPITSVDENQLYSYQVTATDADGDTLTYSLVSFPGWLSIDSNTGLITGTTPPVASDESYQVIVSVSDGVDSDIQIYSLTVVDTSVPGGNGNPGSKGGNGVRIIGDPYYEEQYFNQFEGNPVIELEEKETKKVSSWALVFFLILTFILIIAIILILLAKYY
jgi:hypothetical protein